MKAFLRKLRAGLSGHGGEGYIDTLIKIILCVVIGALLLTGIYAIADSGLDITMSKTSSLFEFNGAGGAGGGGGSGGGGGAPAATYTVTVNTYLVNSGQTTYVSNPGTSPNVASTYYWVINGGDYQNREKWTGTYTYSGLTSLTVLVGGESMDEGDLYAYIGGSFSNGNIVGGNEIVSCLDNAGYHDEQSSTPMTLTEDITVNIIWKS